MLVEGFVFFYLKMSLNVLLVKRPTDFKASSGMLGHFGSMVHM